LRKTTIAAVAALTALLVASVAWAQTPAPAPQLTVKATPAKAGTKKKPRSVKLNLKVENNVESKTTMDTLDVYLPKTFRISGKGFKKCDYIALASNGTDACPAGSKAGSGTANAVLGPYSPAPAPLAFKVTAFVGGKNLILFDLQQTNGSVHTALKGTVKKASGKYGSRLSIKVPDGQGEYANFPNIQQPAPGVYSALVDLQATITLKKGNNVLIGSTGCKGGKHPFKTRLTYSNNPTPPAARTAEDATTVRCTK
jgi:hypothetical protein